MVAHASILAINLRLVKLPYWLSSIVLLSANSDFDNQSPNGSDFDSWSSMSNVDMSLKYQVCFGPLLGLCEIWTCLNTIIPLGIANAKIWQLPHGIYE